MNAAEQPRLWDTTHLATNREDYRAPILVGRQGVFTLRGDLCGYELLFRASGFEGARADGWSMAEQDFATEHVIAAAFHQGTDVTNGLDASVNFTGNYLLSRNDLACDPATVLIEIVESTALVPGLIERVQELKEDGFRVALDDFMVTPAQCALLPLADFVKVDLRDLQELGPELVERARGDDRILVAEHIETQAELDEVASLGFDQVQGYVFERAEVLTIPARDE